MARILCASCPAHGVGVSPRTTGGKLTLMLISTCAIQHPMADFSFISINKNVTEFCILYLKILSLICICIVPECNRIWGGGVPVKPRATASIIIKICL